MVVYIYGFPTDMQMGQSNLSALKTVIIISLALESSFEKYCSMNSLNIAGMKTKVCTGLQRNSYGNKAVGHQEARK